jgi:hypothetical protein
VVAPAGAPFFSWHCLPRIQCTRRDRPDLQEEQREMTNRAVPDEVRRFILTSIPSVPYLEALLLLRSESGRAWDSFNVAGRLYIGENQALELLNAMQQSGIAVRTDSGGFLFAPKAPELTAVIEALAATYSHNLVGVTDLIHSRVEKRAHQFADAFRWKKDAG